MAKWISMVERQASVSSWPKRVAAAPSVLIQFLSCSLSFPASLSSGAYCRLSVMWCGRCVIKTTADPRHSGCGEHPKTALLNQRKKSRDGARARSGSTTQQFDGTRSTKRPAEQALTSLMHAKKTTLPAGSMESSLAR